MLKDRLTKGLFALLAVALVGGALLLSAGAPIVSAGPPLVLTASAEPPTATATATATATPTPEQTAQATPTPEQTAAPADTPGPERSADAAVNKEVSSSEVTLGDEITFFITVTNEGNDTARGVIVEDSLPGWLQVTGASVDKGQAVINGNTVGFWIGDVAPDEVVRGQITARVVAIPEGGEGSNNAVLTSNNNSDRLENNRSSVRVRVRAPTPTLTATAAPAFSIQPTPTPTPTPPPVAVRPPTGSLPVTAGSTSLPIPAWVIMLAAVGYLAVGVYFWRRPRK